MKRVFCRCLKLSMPFYAVRCGRKPGVYATWPECDVWLKAFQRLAIRNFLQRMKPGSLYTDRTQHQLPQKIRPKPRQVFSSQLLIQRQYSLQRMT